MAVAVSYPGVYIQEVPSGVRTIVGVGTSTAMFIGRTTMGELSKPAQCLSYEEFVRKFESSPVNSEMAAAVRLFLPMVAHNATSRESRKARMRRR